MAVMDSTKKNALLTLDLIAEENGLPRYSELAEALRKALNSIHETWTANERALLARILEGV